MGSVIMQQLYCVLQDPGQNKKTWKLIYLTVLARRWEAGKLINGWKDKKQSCKTESIILDSLTED